MIGNLAIAGIIFASSGSVKRIHRSTEKKRVVSLRHSSLRRIGDKILFGYYLILNKKGNFMCVL